MVEAVVLGTVLCYLAIAGCYAATRYGYRRILAAGPRRPAVGAEELTPFELGMLAGGRRRLGEVALAELYLSGRAVAHGHGMVARPWQAEQRPAPDALAPFTRVLDARLPAGRAVPADHLVAAASTSDATTVLLWRLRRLGLLFSPERMRRVTFARNAAWGLQVLIGAAGVPFAGGAAVAAMMAPREPVGIVFVLLAGLFLAYPFLLHLTHRVIGGVRAAVLAAFIVTAAAAPAAELPRELIAALGLFLGWFALYGVYRLTGGGLGPRTRAGDAVLAEARSDLDPSARAEPPEPLEQPGHAEARDRPRPRGPALRATALLGFRELRRRPGKRGLRAPGCPGLGLVRSFATACGRGVGGPDGGLVGDFTGVPGSTAWRRVGGGVPTVGRHHHPHHPRGD
ncbi:TIGR04222 domain-containing membrane protein [Nocardiopsis gilva YIM 90087]|uniref:TIGR04222 domain-containing membrane protein n=1 Tax=Nocardiopsis gilva YIM 90087 TaxID=1235441 RepID=A0A223SDM6_9ACTN|nr:TIGR04222 domain-containing membrane protein [Nocardiopsis gilva YIM 90087]